MIANIITITITNIFTTVIITCLNFGGRSGRTIGSIGKPAAKAPSAPPIRSATEAPLRPSSTRTSPPL